MAKSDEDAFWDFLIKEKEYDYITNVYIQKSKNCADKISKVTFDNKLKLKIAQIKNLKLFYKFKTQNIFEYTTFKHNNLKVYIFLEKQHLNNQEVMGKNKFKVYMRIELINDQIFTKKYFAKKFKKYRKAYNYYLDLQYKFKKMNPLDILDILSLKIDNYYNNLKKEIQKIEN